MSKSLQQQFQQFLYPNIGLQNALSGLGNSSGSFYPVYGAQADIPAPIELPKKKSSIEKLREEIKEWHGDILR